MDFSPSTVYFHLFASSVVQQLPSSMADALSEVGLMKVGKKDSLEIQMFDRTCLVKITLAKLQLCSFWHQDGWTAIFLPLESLEFMAPQKWSEC